MGVLSPTKRTMGGGKESLLLQQCLDTVPIHKSSTTPAPKSRAYQPSMSHGEGKNAPRFLTWTRWAKSAVRFSVRNAFSCRVVYVTPIELSIFSCASVASLAYSMSIANPILIPLAKSMAGFVTLNLARVSRICSSSFCFFAQILSQLCVLAVGSVRQELRAVLLAFLREFIEFRLLRRILLQDFLWQSLELLLLRGAWRLS